MGIGELAAYTFALALNIVIGVSARTGGFWLMRRGRACRRPSWSLAHECLGIVLTTATVLASGRAPAAYARALRSRRFHESGGTPGRPARRGAAAPSRPYGARSDAAPPGPGDRQDRRLPDPVRAPHPCDRVRAGLSA